MTLSQIIKAAITKFSKINMVQYVGIATIILTMWADGGFVNPAFVMAVTGILTLILKAWQSSQEMVSTGYQANWSLWLMGALATVMGILDTWVTNMEIINFISFGNPKLFIMSYMALTVIIRTGFTNQSNNSIAARKAS